MKRILSSAVALVAFCIAFAPSQATANSPQRWGGAYIGVHGGFAFTDLDWGLTYPYGAPPPSTTLDVSNGVGGVHAGIQRQFGTWVAGIEVAYASGTGTQREERLNLWSPNVGTLSTDVGPILTITGRLGYDLGGLLAYVKAGYATAEIALKADDGVPPNFGFDVSHRAHGFTVGAGAELELGKNIFFGLEYNYISLKHDFTTNVVVLASGAPTGGASTSNVDTDIHSFLARLTYKFPN